VDAAASSFLEEDEDDIVRAVVVVPFLSSEHMGVGVGVGDVVSSLLLLSSSSSSTLLVDPTSVPVPISAASSASSSCPWLEDEILEKMICWVGALLLRRQQTSRHDPSSLPTPSTTPPLLPLALEAAAASWNDDTVQAAALPFP